MKVRAAVVAAAGERPAVADIELRAVADGEVLVRVAATGVCHTDLAWASGAFSAGFPAVLGHESAGVVEAVGAGVSRVRPGQHVVLSVTNHCGCCTFCEQGLPVLCDERNTFPSRLGQGEKTVLQGFGIGGFSEATIVRESSAVPVPDGVPLTVAAVAGCAVATGMGAVFTVAQMPPGANALVLGCGGIGLAAVMAASVAGADRIVAVDPLPARRDAALAFGATDVLAPDEEQLRGLAPHGFDYVFEAAGRTDTMELAVRLTRRAGTTVLIGAPSLGETVTLDAVSLVIHHRRILGCSMGGLRPHVDFDRYFRLYRRGRLPLDRLVSATVPLADVATAFDRAESAQGLRTLVTMD